MQRNWILSDLFEKSFARPGQMRGTDDNRSISELCKALLSAEGAVSGYQLTSTVLNRYRNSNDKKKLRFFTCLNKSLEFNPTSIPGLAGLYATAPSTE